ncbi:unnamed protein product [Lactuca virosa]|uniref:Chromo domain-containing protein n=1 Tax=Lactuca virosa TaxID=75947 RepID=A0AAU9N1J8_9ASTR|nr:unnamed protein product [Lactuca virosa]
MERIGKVTYRLELPPESHIHPVFHVSLLRPCYRNLAPSTLSLPTSFIDDLPVLEPESVLDQRIVNNTPHVLVKWKNRDISKATWERSDEFNISTTTVDLEYKVTVKDGGVDTGAQTTYILSQAINTSMTLSSSSSPAPTLSSQSWSTMFFLTLEEKDTRKTFMGHLYSALEQEGIYTFKDNETLP